MRPVHDVAIARRLQQIGRRLALGNPRTQPAAGPDAQRRQPRRHIVDHRPLVIDRQFALRLGIAAAMRGDLVAPVAARLGQAGAAIEHLGIEERGGLQLQPVEQVEQAPRADPIAIIAPGIVHDVRLGLRRGQLGPEPAVKVEHLVVDAEIDGEPAPARPVIDGAIDDGAIAVSVVIGLAHATPTKPRVDGCPTIRRVAQLFAVTGTDGRDAARGSGVSGVGEPGPPCRVA